MMDGENQAGQIEFSHDDIAKRAYQIWQARGCPEGEGDADWQLAITQLAEESRQRRRTLTSNEQLAEGSGRGRGALSRLFDRWKQRAAM